MKRFRSRKGAPGVVEIACRAGVSTATVSRAFNQPETLRKTTLKKVKQAAQDFGYVRDRLAGTMDSQFSGTIGLIVPTIDNAIFAEMIDAFAGQLNRHDRNLLIATHGYDLRLEVDIVRSLLKQRIDAVVLVGLEHEESPLTMLAQRQVPTLSIWNYNKASILPCVGADNHQAAVSITKHLIDLGHRDIALIFPDTSVNDRASDRLKGTLDQAASLGVKINEGRIYSCPYDVGGAKILTEQILTINPPSAIICCNDIIAHGAIYACQSKGVRVPDDISIAGIGDFRKSAYMEPSLTTVRLPARRIGTIAANTITDMSKTGQPPDPFRLNVDFTFIERNSTKKFG